VRGGSSTGQEDFRLGERLGRRVWFGVELNPVGVRDAGEIERAVTTFARGSNGGLIVTASSLTVVHRDLIITLAARHRLACGLRISLLRHPRRPNFLRA
jgi:hypothetical protein